MRRTLMAALVLFCAWTGVAQAKTATGRVDSSSDMAPRIERTGFHTHGTVTIQATLHWMNAGAHLHLSLSRRQPDGSWIHLAKTTSDAAPASTWSCGRRRPAATAWRCGQQPDDRATAWC